MSTKGLTSPSVWCLWFDASADNSILDTKLKSELWACSDYGSWGWYHCGIYGYDPLGFISLWFLSSELHQQVGHSMRQKKITIYFPFLDMSWLGMKSLVRDTGPGSTQGSPAHTVAQSRLDPWHSAQHCPPLHCRGSFFFLSVLGWQEHREAWEAHCQA